MRTWKGVARWCGFLAIVAAVHSSAFTARGQFAMVYEEPVALSERELAGFDRVFKTTPAQHEAAKLLVEGAAAELKTAEKKQGAIGDRWRALPKERRTAEARGKMLAEMRAAEPDQGAVRRRLLGDLRQVLTEEQAAGWHRFEYFLRRERWQASHSGWYVEKVNLIALVERIDLDAPSRAALGPVLEHYERELDPILIDVENKTKELEEAIAPIVARERETGQHDEAGRKGATANYWPAAHRIKALNDDTSRRIMGLIPEAKAAVFRDLYGKATLPEAYGDGRWSDEAIRSSPDTVGLTDEVRGSLRRIVDDYAPNYDRLTLRIAAMERAMRNTPPDGDPPDTRDWDPVRMELGRLTGTIHQRVREVLTDVQYKRMLERMAARRREWEDSMSR